MSSKYDQNMDCGVVQNNSNVEGAFSNVKSWHTFMTSDKRTEVEYKIFQAIFPNPDPAALLDRRMHILRAYVKKVENDMYRKASSREEYYSLIAKKIYRIQEELKKKREGIRLRQQLFAKRSSG